MSGFEILTITFSFIVGLGVAQLLKSLAQVIREKDQIELHWIPFSVAAIVLFFQVQFWFGLAVVNSLMEVWSWPVYSIMLGLAIMIFLAGATALPPSGASGGRSLLQDFKTRGKVSLVFLAAYLAGWIALGFMFRIPMMWHLCLVNGLFAVLATLAYTAARDRLRTTLHLAMIAMLIYGAFTVWTTPSLEMPM